MLAAGVNTRRRGAAIALLVLLPAMLLACRDQSIDQTAEALTGGDRERGRAAIYRYGCASCHRIPGVARAYGLVGPPLSGIGGRSYIGGVLSNTPQNMIRWLQNPPAIAPKTAMPNLDVTEQDARDIAGYLYTLKREEEGWWQGWWR